MDKANELTINKLKLEMKIAYGFLVVDILMLIVGYLGYYGESINTIIDPKQTLVTAGVLQWLRMRLENLLMNQEGLQAILLN
ncbi:MAG: hypothetical protein OIN66_12465 [Candidatus Methanoperedens sp.]|nr:hypothetical protein [Candidatus Methanoperedens sp.]